MDKKTKYIDRAHWHDRHANAYMKNAAFAKRTGDTESYDHWIMLMNAELRMADWYYNAAEAEAERVS